MHPWLVFLKESGKRLSDIEYLAIQEFNGNLVTNTGQQADGGTGNTATLTASSGKDLYLAKAQVTIRLDLASAILLPEITLVANSVIKDRWEPSVLDEGGTGSAGMISQTHDFAVQGIKVAATQTIVIDVVSSDVDIDITGTLVGIEVATGASPAA